MLLQREKPHSAQHATAGSAKFLKKTGKKASAKATQASRKSQKSMSHGHGKKVGAKSPKTRPAKKMKGLIQKQCRTLSVCRSSTYTKEIARAKAAKKLKAKAHHTKSLAHVMAATRKGKRSRHFTQHSNKVKGAASMHQVKKTTEAHHLKAGNSAKIVAKTSAKGQSVSADGVSGDDEEEEDTELDDQAALEDDSGFDSDKDDSEDDDIYEDGGNDEEAANEDSEEDAALLQKGDDDEDDSGAEADSSDGEVDTDSEDASAFLEEDSHNDEDASIAYNRAISMLQQDDDDAMDDGDFEDEYNNEEIIDDDSEHGASLLQEENDDDDANADAGSADWRSDTMEESDGNGSED